MLRVIRERIEVRLHSNAARVSDGQRLRATRAARVAALVAVGGLLCWWAFLVEQRLWSPAVTPTSREVTFDLLVSDADTGHAISGAEIGIDGETGEYDPPGPTWKGITDAGGRLRLVESFRATTVLGKDGKVRGQIVFNTGTPLSNGSYLLVVRAAGYRQETIRLEEKFPRGIAYEDSSPRTIQVRLSPGPAR